MLGMNQSPMTSNQIMDILNHNPMMKNMLSTIIQNPMMMNQMMNIMNSLFYNPTLMNEIKNFINQDNMKNLNTGFNMNNMDPLNQNESINITFLKYTNNGQEKIHIICNKKEKISFVIQKYRDKSNDYSEYRKFIYNSRVLNPSLTVEEADLKENSCIAVIATDNLIG